MLSPIDEGPEDETVQKLDLASEPICTLPEVIGGHGPWQYYHWLVYFVASVCISLQFFSTFPFSSAMHCTCTNVSDPISNNDALRTLISCNESECSSLHEMHHSAKPRNACTNNYAPFLIFGEDENYCFQIKLVIYAKCLYLLGILLSAFTVRFSTIRFGRRITSLTAGFFLLATSIAIAWAKSSATYLILRFIISLGITNIYLISIYSLIEYVGKDYVVLYGLTGHLGWAVAHFILPVLASLTQDWKQFSISISSISLLLFLLISFIPESVEVYIYKGLGARAQSIIRKAAWSNGQPTADVEQFAQTLRNAKSKECTESTAKPRNVQCCFELILLFLIGASASFLYFTSQWLTDWKVDKRGSYFGLTGTTDVASVFILLFFTCFISLKYLWSAATVLTSASFLLLYAKSSAGNIFGNAFQILWEMRVPNY